MLLVRLIPVCMVAVAALNVAALNGPAIGGEFSAEDLVFFESKIRPVLAEHCYRCHSASSESVKAGLRVDSRQSLLAGGDSGPAIEPGDVDASLLIGAIRYEDYEMPPKGKLADDVIEDFVHWIERTAPWPDEPKPTSNEPAAKVFDLEQREKQHWAWQPLQAQTPPNITIAENRAGKSPSDVDRFILAKLEAKGLTAAPPADQAALARRLSFDLIGLPPTPDQMISLAMDKREDAIERFVDRLLDSPHFGERWGRHWLDLVRYAESRGHEFDPDTPGAYQYRDYVIRALNMDVPYGQFVREHIAGDLLREPRLNPDQGFNESILGTGFWFLGEWVHSPVDIRKDESDRFDNMIDCLSKAFMSITVSCARCHDHKFDAISTEDYYALSGYLQSSQFTQVPFESLENNRRVAESLAELDDEFQAKLNEELNRLLHLDPSKPTKFWEHATPPLGEKTVLDYTQSNGDPMSKFFAEGFAYGKRPTAAGEWIVDRVDGKSTVTLAPFGSVRNDPFWNGLEVEFDREVNGQRSSLPIGSGRGLRTPTIELTAPIVSLQVRGAGHVFACVDSHRLVAGPLHGETKLVVKPNDNNSVHWVHMDLSRYVGHRLHFELRPDQDVTFELLRIVNGRERFGSVNPDFANANFEARQWLSSLIERAGPDVAKPLLELQSEWLARRDALMAHVKTRSRLAMAMMDGIGEDDAILIRGNSSTPGKVVTRHFLTAIDPSPLRDPNASGRMELAEAITAPSNPLYARVIVNRVWHHLFGRGIVPTVDDFGVLGQPPTHPELLDYLAKWFLEDGQSMKRLIRKLVLTQTYGMSGVTSADARNRDASNVYYHHRAPKRLEAEIIRDSLLAVSGELNPRMYGESIPVYLTSFMDGRGRPSTSGPSDGDRRRSIYLGIRRNFISPLMLAFDTPVPFSTMGRRTVSNVPAQALILMNDPFVAEQARAWAKRLIRSESDDINARINLLFKTAYARVPSKQEAAALLDYASKQEKDEVEAWAGVTHAVINSKEFIYVP